MHRPTLVALHAHPDDESIFTGGLLVRAAQAGWRTVVVLATSGEIGATPGYHVPAGDLGAHRRREAERACAELGVDRLTVLPYRDSTLAGLPACELAEAVEDALDGESVDVLTSYDERGVYGHPDHVAVHAAGRALAAGGLPVYEATIDRAHLHRLRDALVGRRALAPWVWPADLTGRIGTNGGDLVHLTLDEDGELPAKLAAIAAHGSQVTFAREFMGIPPGAFHHLLAHEWFAPAGERSPGLEDLAAAMLAPA